MNCWFGIERRRKELRWMRKDELRWQRVDRFLTAACNVFIGLAAWYGLMLLGIAAGAGRLGP